MTDHDDIPEIDGDPFQLARSNPFVISDFQMTHNCGKLFAAMAKAQGEMEDATKTKQNTFFDSMYADFADVRAPTRAALSKHGLAIIHFPTTTDDGRAGVITILSHESGEFIKATLFLPVPANKDGLRQTTGFGASISYAKRYMHQAICGIAADEDNDMQGTETAYIDAKTAQEFQARIEALSETPKGKAQLVTRFCKKFGVDGLNTLPLDQLDAADAAIREKETGNAVPTQD